MIRKIYNKSMNYKYMRSECWFICGTIVSNTIFKNFIKSNLYFKNISSNILNTCLNNYKIEKKKRNILILMFLNWLIVFLAYFKI